MNTPRRGAYAIHTAREGFSNILHLPSGEIMHSRMNPTEEAELLYVGQSCLRERLMGDPCDPLVVWDVGLGAAANAMAAVRCHEALTGCRGRRRLRVLSFENDLDSLSLAMAHTDRFPYLQHPAPGNLLEHGCWRDEALEWELVIGNFPDSLSDAIPAPHVIFYDMYSAKTEPGPWDLATLCKVRDSCGDNRCELITYTVSTAARAKLLVAGFYVARGPVMGQKEETTIALTPGAVAYPVAERDLLDDRWLGKWNRSSARFPADIPNARHEAFSHAVLSHTQFSTDSVS